MKDNLKLLLKYIMRFVLKVFWVFPIRKKTVFFMANMGKGFLCNPKYIYLSMVGDERFKDYLFYWSFINPKKLDKSLFSENTKLINKHNLFSYFYYLLTSEIIIYNCWGFSYAPIRKKQFLIETMHGSGAFKRGGFTVSNKTQSSKKGISLANKDIKLYLTTSDISTQYGIRESLQYYGEVLDSGMPRIDVLFNYNNEKINQIKNVLKIPESSKVVLYAPTFKGREDGAVSIATDCEMIDPCRIKDALKDRFGGDWLFLTRGHQYVRELSIEGADLDVSSYQDMQEILLITDVLITDYSSSQWDFSFLNRPIFLFVPDLIQYENGDRGFVVPIEQWPGIIARTNRDLIKIIETYDQESFENVLNKHHLMAGSHEHGDASDKVKQRILDFSETNGATRRS